MMNGGVADLISISIDFVIEFPENSKTTPFGTVTHILSYCKTVTSVDKDHRC